MQPDLELVHIRKGESFAAWMHGYPFRTVRWHYHPEYEIHLVVDTRGTFYIGDEGPIALGPDDSGLTLAAYPGEEGSVWLSGGKPLSGLKWEAHAVHPAKNGTLAPETGVNNQHGPSP